MVSATSSPSVNVVYSITYKAGMSGGSENEGIPAPNVLLSGPISPGYLYMYSRASEYTFISNDRVRRIFTSNETVNTLAGLLYPSLGYSGATLVANGAEMLPNGIAFNSTSGTEYLISDRGSCCIGSVSLTTGNITNFAGVCSSTCVNSYGYTEGANKNVATFNLLSGLFYHASSGSVFVCDQGNNVVRRIAASGSVTTVAGIASSTGGYVDNVVATSGKLNTPNAVFVNAAGEVFISG